jgi:hypothetical protein
MPTQTMADADPDWEYAPLRIPSDVTRVNAAVRLALHAEYGGWELDRLRLSPDGTRRVVLRRKIIRQRSTYFV